jgi:hypothetical protein
MHLLMENIKSVYEEFNLEIKANLFLCISRVQSEYNFP